MSNNSDFAATMYESDPMVAALNKVPGFDPLKLMNRRRNPGAEPDERYLDFRYKKLWFRLAHRKGRIRLNKLSVTEQIAIFEAQVYLELTDANPISSFTAICTKEKAGEKYIESAQIKAMDQALTDAGFGLQFVPAPTGGTENIVTQAATSPVANTQISDTAPKAAQPAMQQATVQQRTVAPAPQVAVQQKPVAVQPTAHQPATPQQRPMTQQAAVQQKSATAQSVARQHVTPQAKVQQGQIAPQSASQQRPMPVQQQSVTPQAAAAAQALQGGQKEAPKSVQAQAGMQKTAVSQAASALAQKPAAVVAPTSQLATKQPAGAEALSSEQLPVTAEKQELPIGSDMAAAMTMLSGKKEPDTQPIAPSGTKAEIKAEAMPEELPVTPTAETSAVPGAATSVGQEAMEDKPYTEVTPVEEILKSMTLEDAKKVVVPSGTCQGWTLKEVAERRRSSLKFYVSEGYQGKDNILRAAARLMLDDLERKAS